VFYFDNLRTQGKLAKGCNQLQYDNLAESMKQKLIIVYKAYTDTLSTFAPTSSNTTNHISPAWPRQRLMGGAKEQGSGDFEQDVVGSAGMLVNVSLYSHYVICNVNVPVYSHYVICS